MGYEQRHFLTLMETHLVFFRPAFLMFNYCYYVSFRVGCRIHKMTDNGKKDLNQLWWSVQAIIKKGIPRFTGDAFSCHKKAG